MTGTQLPPIKAIGGNRSRVSWGPQKGEDDAANSTWKYHFHPLPWTVPQMGSTGGAHKCTQTRNSPVSYLGSPLSAREFSVEPGLAKWSHSQSYGILRGTPARTWATLGPGIYFEFLRCTPPSIVQQIRGGHPCINVNMVLYRHRHTLSMLLG